MFASRFKSLTNPAWSLAFIVWVTLLSAANSLGQDRAADTNRQAREQARRDRQALEREIGDNLSELGNDLNTLNARWKEALQQARSALETQSEMRVELRRPRIDREISDSEPAEAVADGASQRIANLYEARHRSYSARIEELAQSLESAWDNINAEDPGSMTQAAAELDRRRAEWLSWYQRLRLSQQQRLKYLHQEIASIREKVAATADQWNEAAIATRTQMRKRYENDAFEMRQCFRESIDVLREEAKRLRTIVPSVDDGLGLKFLKMSDVLFEQSNTLERELVASYRESLFNLQQYAEHHRAQWSRLPPSVIASAEAEMDHVARSTCLLQRELMDCCDNLRDSLQRQIAAKESLEPRWEIDLRRQRGVMESLQANLRRCEQEVAETRRDFASAVDREITRQQKLLSVAKDPDRKRQLTDSLQELETQRTRLGRAKQ